MDRPLESLMINQSVEQIADFKVAIQEDSDRCHQ